MTRTGGPEVGAQGAQLQAAVHVAAESPSRRADGEIEIATAAADLSGRPARADASAT
jgi:hypothetical protein